MGTADNWQAVLDNVGGGCSVDTAALRHPGVLTQNCRQADTPSLEVLSVRNLLRTRFRFNTLKPCKFIPRNKVNVVRKKEK